MEAAMKTVKWNPARIKRMYRAGKNVSQIAKAIGYAPNTGNNRVRNLLQKSGVYKSSTK
jgi:DNA-binding NarL/FixJ family response regulator